MLGLAIVLATLIYALRDGDTPLPVPRPLSTAQRRNWLLTYVTATVMFIAGFDVLDHLDGLHWQAVSVHTNLAAVAFLRGLALATVSISLCLGRYLRAGCAKARTSEV
jgi:hypothetical protein